MPRLPADSAIECEYEELGHTAEIGMRVRAATPHLLFACAGQSMFRLIGALADETALFARRIVTVESVDMESLMVDWLSELVYLHEIYGVVLDAITVIEWSPTQMIAMVDGHKLSQSPRMYIKAVTYHDLYIRPEDAGWTADIYFDI